MEVTDKTVRILAQGTVSSTKQCATRRMERVGWDVKGAMLAASVTYNVKMGHMVLNVMKPVIAVKKRPFAIFGVEIVQTAAVLVLMDHGVTRLA